jgi:hypothetical protein
LSAPLQPEDRTCLPSEGNLQHRELILNHFRTFRCLELALYHSFGKFREPESTHEFF